MKRRRSLDSRGSFFRLDWESAVGNATTAAATTHILFVRQVLMRVFKVQLFDCYSNLRSFRQKCEDYYAEEREREMTRMKIDISCHVVAFTCCVATIERDLEGPRTSIITRKSKAEQTRSNNCSTACFLFLSLTFFTCVHIYARAPPRKLFE